MEACFGHVNHGGRVAFVGHTKNIVSFENPVFHQKELIVMGSRNATGQDFNEVIARIKAGQIKTKVWISHTLTKEEGKTAIDYLSDPSTGVIKAMIKL
mmetsp:Transcript_42579/g.109521  ORF Transcript_42579/g.109521 Transcript_42579/m.109521 type:complete len:98 (-) Transcript_42579:189-482(-)